MTQEVKGEAGVLVMIRLGEQHHDISIFIFRTFSMLLLPPIPLL